MGTASATNTQFNVDAAVKWLLSAILCWYISVIQASELLIIIDDIGNNRELGERTLALPGPLTVAILPHTPYARSLAEQAHALGHGVMLHAPMENGSGAALGPGALYTHMPATELQRILIDSLAAVPFATGVNNHMGSHFTRHTHAMEAILDVIEQRGLFFVDSLTHADSVAAKLARQREIPTLTRHVFLDHERTPEAIEAQFQRALRHAKQHGYVVLIGHPYPETLDFLEHALPTLTPQGIFLRRADGYLQRQTWSSVWDIPSVESRYLLQDTGLTTPP